MVRDLASTNGVLVNGVPVKRAPLHPGDRLQVGVFELVVQGDEDLTAAPAAPESPPAEQPFGDATIIRPVTELAGPLREETYGERAVASMIRLAGFLIRADSLDAVLGRVMDAAFEALPVDRGFILLGEGDDLVCELVRVDDRVEVRPTAEVPVSKTMLKAVIDRQVALVTVDARTDERLAGGESIRIHQIRAAMCVPLWSGERIVGVMQLDTPFRAGSFGDRELDLAGALANYAAVAVERIRFARRAEEERWLRARLERYHSPAVVEEVLGGHEVPEAGAGRQPVTAADVTVLFADVVGFTPFAETASPEAVAALLGAFFDRAVEAIFAAGGTLDKFIGDCVMAFFGAPVAQPDHARRAVEAALAIQRAIADWNRERAAPQRVADRRAGGAQQRPGGGGGGGERAPGGLHRARQHRQRGGAAGGCGGAGRRGGDRPGDLRAAGRRGGDRAAGGTPPRRAGATGRRLPGGGAARQRGGRVGAGRHAATARRPLAAGRRGGRAPRRRRRRARPRRRSAGGSARRSPAPPGGRCSTSSLDLVAVTVLFVFREPATAFLTPGASEEGIFTLGILAVVAHAGYRFAQYRHLRTVARLHEELGGARGVGRPVAGPRNAGR